MYQPLRCPACGRTRWTHADRTYCLGGKDERHSHAEMELIHPDEAPAETTPDIVTT